MGERLPARRAYRASSHGAPTRAAGQTAGDGKSRRSIPSYAHVYLLMPFWLAGRRRCQPISARAAMRAKAADAADYFRLYFFLPGWRAGASWRARRRHPRHDDTADGAAGRRAL